MSLSIHNTFSFAIALIEGSGHLTGAPKLIVEVLSNAEKEKKRDRLLPTRCFCGYLFFKLGFFFANSRGNLALNIFSGGKHT
jgi:hypothetical protein